MEIVHCAVSHKDGRGIIRDVFEAGAPDSVTVVSSVQGAIRGNHFHRASTQYTYLVSGRLRVVVRDVRDDASSVETHVLTAGDLVRHDPYEAHAYFAEQDSVLLAFAKGLRKGRDYERDTYRLPRPLISADSAAEGA